MRLCRLDVRRLAGGEAVFRLEGFARGLNLIVGPNGSGKSSLCRALRATLWPGCEPAAGAELVSVWELEGTLLRAELGYGVTWQRDGSPVPPPPLPPDHLARTYTLGLRDLLADDSPADRDLAGQIHIQMYGGFDLAALRSRLSPRHHGRQEEAELVEAERVLSRLQGERRQLAEEDDRLAEQREQLAAARHALQELEQLRAAAQLAACVQSRRELQRALDGFAAPAEAMEQLVGNELEQLDALETDRTRADREREAARERLATAERDQRACGLRGPVPDEPELAAWKRWGRDLERAIAEAERVGEECARARAARDAALRELAGDVAPAHVAGLTAAELNRLSEWLARAFDAADRRSRLESLLESGRVGAGDAGSPLVELEVLRRGVDLLRDWLAVPEGSLADSGWPRALAIGSGLLAFALAFAWPGGFHPALLPAVVGFAFAWLLVWLPGPGRGSLRRRAALEESFGELGLAGPSRFERVAVRERLRSLEADLARAERADAAQIERAAVSRQLAELEPVEEQLRRDREALRAGLGVDPGLGDLALSDLAGRVRGWREAEAALVPSLAALERLEAAREDLLGKLRPRLSETLGREAQDEAHALAALDALFEGCQSWRAAEERRLAAERDIASCESKRRDLLARRAARLREWGVEAGSDPDTARRVLSERLADFGAYRETSERQRAVGRLIAELERALEGRADLQGLAPAQVEDRIARAEALAATSDDVAGRIGGIEERIRAARESGDLEARRARVTAAREELQEQREELLLALAGDFLLGAVEGEYERVSRPAVLRSAAEYFARFTRHRYELRLQGSGADTRFQAVETGSGRELSLSQLSDGTRMQLLLAARGAVASRAEQDVHPPLFLDESLSASDPERFRAAAESLLGLAGSGRQIFYLTCNPADVALWQSVARDLDAPEPEVFDLGEIRRWATAAVEPGQLEVPRPPAPPPPEGLDPESYAALLGVPAPEPFAPIGSLHLFHLLRDDLGLLHDLLSRGRIECVGHWRSFQAVGVAAALFGEDACRRIAARVRVAEAFFEAWRVGRGRPVDRAALEQSGAVSGIFMQRLCSLAAESGGDAAALLEAIEVGRDDRVRHFRSQQLEALRAHLEERGYLASVAPLEPDALRARVLAASAELLSSPPRGESPGSDDVEMRRHETRPPTPALTGEEVLRLVDELTSLVAS